MKKILALLAVLVISYSSFAAGVRIFNNTGYPFFGNFTNNIISGGVPGFTGTVPVSIPPMSSVTFPTVGDFFMAVTGAGSPGIYAPPSLQLTGYWFEPMPSNCTLFSGQPGSSVNFNCPLIPPPATIGFNATTTVTIMWTTITLNNW